MRNLSSGTNIVAKLKLNFFGLFPRAIKFAVPAHMRTLFEKSIKICFIPRNMTLALNNVTFSSLINCVVNISDVD
ncbi:unnamed protein product [Rotaria sp. Silwood1]|nr:unnamed protein product [Rotaria sp. Silwood1]